MTWNPILDASNNRIPGGLRLDAFGITSRIEVWYEGDVAPTATPVQFVDLLTHSIGAPLFGVWFGNVRIAGFDSLAAAKTYAEAFFADLSGLGVDLQAVTV